MKEYRFEVIIKDYENIGSDGIQSIIENVCVEYPTPRSCNLNIEVIKIEEKENNEYKRVIIIP